MHNLGAATDTNARSPKVYSAFNVGGETNNSSLELRLYLDGGALTLINSLMYS